MLMPAWRYKLMSAWSHRRRSEARVGRRAMIIGGVLIFILVLVTHVHTTDIQCMQALSMYSMGQMLTRTCTFKGASSAPTK
jgi:hypothetical protein